MANTFKFGNGEWAVGKETALAYNDENSNFKPLPFTFDRGSIGTVVNKQGLIETVGIDEPRIDFLNNTKGHLLLEPSRTNLYPYSEKMSAWGYNFNAGTASLPVVTDNVGVSPDGTQNASRVVMNLNGGTTLSDRTALRVLITASTNVHTQSFYLKSNTSDSYNITFHFLGGHRSVYTVTPEWQRFSYTEAAGTSVYTGIELRGSITSDYADILVWGAQFEQGSYATSYIPTQGETNGVTRSAETCNNAGNSTVFNDSEGVLYAEISAFDENQEEGYITISDGSTSNVVWVGFKSGKLRGRFVSTSNNFIEDDNVVIENSNKIACSYSSSNFKVFINGSQIGNTQTITTPLVGIVQLNFDRGNGAINFIGKTKDIKVYNTALTDAELIALTS